jgi:uncharacterized protein YbbK (DUF523 family)
MNQAPGHVQDESDKPEHHQHKHNGSEHVCPPSRLARGRKLVRAARRSLCFEIGAGLGLPRRSLRLRVAYRIEERLCRRRGRYVAS